MATVHIRRYIAATEWLTGPVWAIKTPYEPDFIDALKSEIHARHREWVRPARVWIVTEAQKGRLKGLLVEHFGEHEICTACAKGFPCWVWRAVDAEAAAVGLKGASCGASDTSRGGAPDPDEQARQARAEQNAREKKREREEQARRERERAQSGPRSSAPGGGSWDDFWSDFARNTGRGRTHDQRREQPARNTSNVLTVREAAALLGVDVNASPADVKKAFARAALANHPDRGGDHEKMVQVNRAKEAFDAHFARTGARV